MFQTLSPRAAADLAQFMRRNTCGMDSDWPHLMIIGSRGYFADLVKRHEQERARRG